MITHPNWKVQKKSWPVIFFFTLFSPTFPLRVLIPFSLLVSALSLSHLMLFFTSLLPLGLPFWIEKTWQDQERWRCCIACSAAYKKWCEEGKGPTWTWTWACKVEELLAGERHVLLFLLIHPFLYQEQSSLHSSCFCISKEQYFIVYFYMSAFFCEKLVQCKYVGMKNCYLEHHRTDGHLGRLREAGICIYAGDICAYLSFRCSF